MSWEWQDIWNDLNNSDFWTNPLTILIIGAVVTISIVLILQKLIRTFFKKTSFISEKKERTIESMLNSAIRYTATISYIIFVLNTVFDIDVGGILAGAGVLGIVLGFGAQSLIKDLLAGLFLLYEKQLEQGDWIKINNTFSGTVEEIGLRFLKIREWSGVLLTISNGQINTIENYNMEEMRVLEHITTSFYQNPKEVFQVLEDICEQLNDELYPYLKKGISGEPIEPFMVYGMSSVNDHYQGYQYTITGLCNDEVYFTAAKETRRIIAENVYENGLNMAEQHIDIRRTKS
ncbi:small-conductance mechanosensitive channel [Gracilibacillus halophilus YIM-C55.5]|uniref:Small-conductance mechanosensitive channel n=1 Tax=Gracilibacillus halophilus YIM-C55.5 TaxID=1308866 RepID=N4WPF2_9BACI|nr:mechanosensitive ion channel family protein [Gracilibacillus halophilus]ENH97997.1 small-conductance mechanosensitive channel [Gracilibacillus halophilus YIM-C55.5]